MFRSTVTKENITICGQYIIALLSCFVRTFYSDTECPKMMQKQYSNQG